MELKNDIFAGINDEVKEHYTFTFTREEVMPVKKKQTAKLKKRFLFPVIYGMICLIGAIFTDNTILDFGLGIAFAAFVLNTKMLSGFKKSYAASEDMIEKTVYDYTIYENYLIIWLSSDKCVRQMKLYFNEIKSIQDIDGIISLETTGGLYLLKKDELAEESFFLSACKKEKAKK